MRHIPFRQTSFTASLSLSLCTLPPNCSILKRAAAHEELLKGLESVIELGLVLRHALGKAVGHGGGDELLYHTHDLRVDILAVKHLAALAVDDVALLVHDVIVFEDALTGLEVAALDRALRLLDGVGEHLMVKRGVLIDLHGVHKAGEPVGAEETHDIVRQRKEEAALAGVALTAGTAAQLVIDTAGLVALGAEDEQAADGAHLSASASVSALCTFMRSANSCARRGCSHRPSRRSRWLRRW